MADGEEQPPPPPQQQQPQDKLPQVNYLSVASDDYVYQSKPLPRRAQDEINRNQMSGGMASQFEIASSGLTNNA